MRPQVLDGEVESYVDCVIYRPVGKLQGVQERVQDSFEVCQHQALKILNYHRGQVDGSLMPQYASASPFTDGRAHGYARIDYSFIVLLRLWVLKTIHRQESRWRCTAMLAIGYRKL